MIPMKCEEMFHSFARLYIHRCRNCEFPTTKRGSLWRDLRSPPGRKIDRFDLPFIYRGGSGTERAGSAQRWKHLTALSVGASGEWINGRRENGARITVHANDERVAPVNEVFFLRHLVTWSRNFHGNFHGSARRSARLSKSWTPRTKRRVDSTEVCCTQPCTYANSTFELGKTEIRERAGRRLFNSPRAMSALWNSHEFLASTFPSSLARFQNRFRKLR